MLDIQYIRDNADLVKTSAKNKNANAAVVDNLLEVDVKRRELIGKVEIIRAERNKLNDQLKTARTDELIAKSKELKLELENIEPELKQLEVAFADLMLQRASTQDSAAPTEGDWLTSLDLNVQQVCERSIADRLSRLSGRNGARGLLRGYAVRPFGPDPTPAQRARPDACPPLSGAARRGR